MAPAETLRVEVAYCPQPGQAECVVLALPAGATLADALRGSGLIERHGLQLQALRVGVWGRLQPLETALRENDRVEIYRALQVDPKEARRQRYRRHREAKTAAA